MVVSAEYESLKPFRSYSGLDHASRKYYCEHDNRKTGKSDLS
jgi:hypothetical protein